jgi:uncharacterized protein DUF3168
VLKDALYARSQAVAGLTALIGTRFYDVQAPQNTAMPYCTHQIVSAERIHVMGRDTLGRARVQVDSWGSERQDAEDVNAQVVAAFNRWGGTLASVIVKDTIILSGGIDVEADDVSLIPRVTSELEVIYEL